MRIPTTINKFPKSYDNLYDTFSRKCLTRNTPVSEIKSNFLELQEAYIRARQVDEFSYRTEELSCDLAARGNFNLVSIFNAEIGKMYMHFGYYDKAEQYIWDSLNICRNSNDNIHVLARLNDLEIIYKDLGEIRNLFRVLRAKKECIKALIADYDGNVKNYRSISRPATSLEAIKIQLAYTYTELAQLLFRKFPQDSIKATQKARDIYAEIGHTKEQHYLEEKIRRMEYRLSQRKTSEPPKK